MSDEYPMVPNEDDWKYQPTTETFNEIVCERRISLVRAAFERATSRVDLLALIPEATAARNMALELFCPWTEDPDAWSQDYNRLFDANMVLMAIHLLLEETPAVHLELDGPITGYRNSCLETARGCLQQMADAMDAKAV